MAERPYDGEHGWDDAVLELVRRSELFDEEYYRRQQLELAGIDDLLRHYLEVGWLDNLNPSAAFDTAYYLAMNPDVRESGMNPLVHYLRYGQFEAREPIGHDGAPPDALVSATAPPPEAWETLARRDAGKAPVVDVIVPVYRGVPETMRCLYSVLAAPVRTPYELWVVDDASPEPEIADALDELEAMRLIRLIRNDANLGFVRSCNLAMRLHPRRDVVLLNSDTEVFGDWLDRLRAAASHANVGTVTPFSNNADICSYPSLMRNHNRRMELADAELDALFAGVNRGEIADLPTAVGFCTFLRRDCLDAVGLFDEDAFGHGYGEENDLSRRALRAGWRNVLAADVFVRHHGGVSFGDSKIERAHAASITLTRLHPDYSEAVRAFVRDDPLMPLRRRIDVARIRNSHHGRAFLFVTHNRGGGTERHVLDMAERIVRDGSYAIFCRATHGSNSRLRFEAPSLAVPNLPAIDIPGGIDAFVDLAGALGVSEIHVHHLADLPMDAADFFRIGAKRLGIHYDVTIHDYFYVCPRINLIDASGFYCGEPDEDGCTRCLSHAGSEFGAPEIWSWRDRYERFLRGARAVFVPDRDVALRLERYLPGLPYAIRPHPESAHGETAQAAAGAPGGARARRRIGLIGAIGPHKGSRLLLECARIARNRGLPVDFTVIGYTDVDAELERLGVTITGPYSEDELAPRIDAAALDLAWFPSVWPETYCYTLSAALRARVYPVAFDIGAIASRLRAARWGHLMPLEAFFDAERVVEELAGLPIEPPPAEHGPAARPDGPFVEEYYGLSAMAPDGTDHAGARSASAGTRGYRASIASNAAPSGRTRRAAFKSS